MSGLNIQFSKNFFWLIIIIAGLIITSCETPTYNCGCEKNLSKEISVDSLCKILNNKFTKADEYCSFNVTSENLFQVYREGNVWETNIKYINCNEIKYRIWKDGSASIEISIKDRKRVIEVRDKHGKILVDFFDSFIIVVKPASLLKEIQESLCDLLCKVEEMKSNTR